MDNLVQKLHPSIREYVIYILKKDKSDSRNIKISELIGYNNGIDNQQFADKFTVSMCYAGRFIECKVKFFIGSLHIAPNIYMNDTLADTILLNYVPSWKEWDSTKLNCLYNVLVEFFAWFKLYEIQRFMNASGYIRLQFEYKELVKRRGKDNVEVMMDTWGSVHIAVCLHVDFLLIPKDLFADQAMEPKAFYLVSFFKPYFNVIQCSLYVIPEIQKLRRDIWEYCLPIYNYDYHLFEHVPKVEKILRTKIDDMTQRQMLKGMYICQLLTLFPKNILEFDSINHIGASLMFQSRGFLWFLYIGIGNNFPRCKPTWIIRSIYYNSEMGPEMYINTMYPYNPKWCIDKMIKTALEHTIQYISQNNHWSYTYCTCL